VVHLSVALDKKVERPGRTVQAATSVTSVVVQRLAEENQDSDWKKADWKEAQPIREHRSCARDDLSGLQARGSDDCSTLPASLVPQRLARAETHQPSTLGIKRKGNLKC